MLCQILTFVRKVFLLKTITVKEKCDTASKPYIVIGSDFKSYYCKFPVENNTPYDLLNEVTCSYLALLIGLPTPQFKLIEISANSFDHYKFPFLNANSIGFASKEIGTNYQLSNESNLDLKKTISRLSNLEDFLRIVVFDKLIGNRDRLEQNFNLLLRKKKFEESLVAIDHVQSFQSETDGILNRPHMHFNSIHPSLVTSDFGHLICNKIGTTNCRTIVTEFLKNWQQQNIGIIKKSLNGYASKLSLTQEDVNLRVNFCFNQDRIEDTRNAFEEFFNFV